MRTVNTKAQLAAQAESIAASRKLFVDAYKGDAVARDSEWEAYLTQQEEQLRQEIRENLSVQQRYLADINRAYPASNYMLFSSSPHYQEIDEKIKEAGEKRKQALFKYYQEHLESAYLATEDKLKKYIALKPEYYKIGKNLQEMRDILHTTPYTQFIRQHDQTIPWDIRNLPDEAQVKKRLIEEYDQKRADFLANPLEQIEAVYLKSKSPRYNPALKQYFLEKNSNKAFEEYSAAHFPVTPPELLPHTAQAETVPTASAAVHPQYPPHLQSAHQFPAPQTNASAGLGNHLFGCGVVGAAAGGLVSGVRSQNPLSGFVKGGIMGVVAGGINHAMQQKTQSSLSATHVGFHPPHSTGHNPGNHTLPMFSAQSRVIPVQTIPIQAMPTPAVEPTAAVQAAPNEMQASRNATDVLWASIEQLTWGAEGTETACRQPHCPGERSGVTIGHGYDLKYRTAQQVRTDLKTASFPDELIEIFADCVGLTGEASKKKVAELKLRNIPDITLEQQKKLFELIIPSYIDDVKRIFINETDEKDRQDSAESKWEILDSRIKAVLVDLRYVGHYTEESREHIQGSVKNNDFEAFKTVLSNETLWTKPRAEDGIFSKRPPVAPDRFKRRVEFLKSPAIDMQNPGNKQFKKK